MLFNILFFIVVFIIIIKKVNEKPAKGKTPEFRPPELRNNNSVNVNNVNEQLSEAQKRYQQRLQEYQSKQQVKPAQQAKPVQQAKTVRSINAASGNKDIISRAKNNADKLKEDTTLTEIESFHKHSEKQVAKPVEHSQVCQSHLQNDNVIEPGESVLGSIEDLMIKGYSGDMKFERDFVGEALDMVANFSIQN
ncbi:MAG: hypothetical protein SOW32_01395 [Agathobacter sp.]|nr:hypothetical protein [Agathobacter sp.]